MAKPKISTEYVTLPQPDPGQRFGRAVYMRVLTEPNKIRVRQVHWAGINEGWQKCGREHCPWCLEANKITQRYEVTVELDDGTIARFDMALGMYRVMLVYIHRLGAKFTQTRFSVLREGEGIHTIYNMRIVEKAKR